MIRRKPFDHAQVSAFCAFSRKYYDNVQTTDEDFVAWKFPVDGPFAAHHLTYEVGDAVQGRAVLCRRPFHFHGQDLTLTQPSDLLIDPDVSGAACLVQLVNAYPEADSQGIVHTSNEKSEFIYKRLFKFEQITELTSVTMPVAIENVLPRRWAFLPARALLWIAGWVIEFFYLLVLAYSQTGARTPAAAPRPVAADDPKLSNAFKRLAPAQITRNRDFLAWRYAEAPMDYRELHVTADGETLAKVVYRLAEYRGISSLVIMDWLIARPLSLAEKAACLVDLRRIARRHGAIQVYYLGNFRNLVVRHLGGFGFFPIPDRLLPHASPIFGYAFEDPLTGNRLKDIYLTLGDLDYF